MKPPSSESIWKNLVSSARKVPDERGLAAPLGFAARVTALALERPQISLAAMIDRLSWRALAVSCILTALCIASSYSSWVSLSEDDMIPQDPVSEIIEQSSWF